MIDFASELLNTQYTRRQILRKAWNLGVASVIPWSMINKVIDLTYPQPPPKGKEAEIVSEIDPLMALADLSHLPDMPITDFRLHSSYRPTHPAYPKGTSFMDYANPDVHYDFAYLAFPDEKGKLIHYPNPETEDGVYYIAPDLSSSTLVTGIYQAYDNPKHIWDGNMDTGNIEKIGNIVVRAKDGKVIIDKAADDFFLDSDHQAVTATFHDVGASVSLYPLVLPDGGTISLTRSPKWFGVESVTYSKPMKEPRVETMRQLAVIRKTPEKMPEINKYTSLKQNDQVSEDKPLILQLSDIGMLTGLQVKVPKGDLGKLRIRIKYGQEENYAIDESLQRFFATDQQLLHHDYPYGVVEEDDGKSLICYLNLPIPYNEGTVLEITSDSSDSTDVELTHWFGQQTSEYRLRTWSGEKKTLEPAGEDYSVDIPCHSGGKLVTAVVEIDGYDQHSSPNPNWNFAFMESNLRITVDDILKAIYTGLEDFAHGGYFWDLKKNTNEANNPMSGGPLGMDLDKSSWCNIFRFFGLSSIPFSKNINITVGHGYNGGENGNNLKVNYKLRGLYYEK